MMKGTRSSPGSTTSLFIVFLLSVFDKALLHVCANSFHNVRLPLVHKYSPHFHEGIHLHNKTDLEIVKELHLHDINRLQKKHKHRHEHHRHHVPKPKKLDAAEASLPLAIPMHSGFDIFSGLYWVEVRFGTPPKPLFLMADTGSDLTWVKCKYDPKSTKEEREKLLSERIHHRASPKKISHLLNTKGRTFHADLSSTFKIIPCSNSMCKNELVMMHSVVNHCPTPSSPCRYHYTYLGGNGAVGFFAHETVTIPLPNGNRTHLPNLVIGCTHDTQNFDNTDGIMGLGFADSSIPETIVRSKIAYKFSYCLMDHRTSANVASYLTFGTNKQAVITSPMKYTKLVLHDARNFKTGFYGTNVEGISIGGTMLNIPNQIWEEMSAAGGMTFDSGSTATHLAVPIYEAVMVELTKALSNYKRVDLSNEGVPFEFCFYDEGFNESAVPRLAFHFAGGVVYDPPVKNYVHIASKGLRCLGFVPSEGLSIIGNQMQQNYLWEYDIERGTVGFAPSDCI